MANKTIHQVDNFTSTLSLSDQLLIYDVSTDTTNRTTFQKVKNDLDLGSGEIKITNIEDAYQDGTTTNLHGINLTNGTSQSSASGNYAIALGYNSTASGNYSFTEGYKTESSGRYSHSEGQQTQASADSAHAEGFNTTAGQYAHAEGQNTVAIGNPSHAEGRNTRASGHRAHAEGYATQASADSAHAEGGATTASGARAHAEGQNTLAIQQNAHAEGLYSNASGDSSHAEGVSSTASGYASHAEGNKSIASGYASHAQNRYTIAASTAQTALGKYNIQDNQNTYAVILGNGTSTASRSNAMTVDWDGNLWVANDVKIGNSSVSVLQGLSGNGGNSSTYSFLTTQMSTVSFNTLEALGDNNIYVANDNSYIHLTNSTSPSGSADPVYPSFIGNNDILKISGSCNITPNSTKCFNIMYTSVTSGSIIFPVVPVTIFASTVSNLVTYSGSGGHPILRSQRIKVPMLTETNTSIPFSFIFDTSNLHNTPIYLYAVISGINSTEVSTTSTSKIIIATTITSEDISNG